MRRLARLCACRPLGGLTVLVGLAIMPPRADARPAQAPPDSHVDRVVAVRVHGNHTTPDEDVLAIARLAAGEVVTPELLAAVHGRLEGSGRFRSVEVRKRYASLTDANQVVVVLFVEEHAGITIDVPQPGVVRRVAAGTMWLPVLRHDDGYGFTYGARLAFVDLLGPRTRVSLPVTWGGERRAGVEVERTFARGPFTRVQGTAAVWRREHPAAEVPERRFELVARGERALGRWLRAGGTARRAEVWFAAPIETMGSLGADLVLDTSRDPAFPRNGVSGRVAVERLWFEHGSGTWRTSFETRGYVGVLGRTVLAVGVQHTRGADPLPLYEQALLGGAATLRGFRLGYKTGDRLVAVSSELRIPVSSPLRVGRAGFTVFADHGAVYGAGEPLSTARFDTGAGAGVFAQWPVLRFRLEVARGLGAGTRAHVSLGATF
jgi:hypothetical protein